MISRLIRSSIVAAVLAGCFAASSVPAGDASVEYRVKAAFLYNFAKFVEWPDDPGSSFSFCVLGRDPFGANLDRTLERKSVRGLPVEVLRISVAEEALDCEVLFVADPDLQSLRKTLDSVLGDVLTVGDAPRFAATGGVIGFVTEAGHVRFEVNLSAAAEKELKLSSKLLNLARIVTPEE